MKNIKSFKLFESKSIVNDIRNLYIELIDDGLDIEVIDYEDGVITLSITKGKRNLDGFIDYSEFFVTDYIKDILTTAESYIRSELDYKIKYTAIKISAYNTCAMENTIKAILDRRFNFLKKLDIDISIK